MRRRRAARVLFAAVYPIAVGGALYALGLPVVFVGLFTAAALLGSYELVRRPPRPVAPPRPPPAEERCPRCGAGIDDLERDTSSGRAIYHYSCRARCGWFERRDEGIALWKALETRDDG